jgi:DNA helicase-2/ATP-dependent DNA helicase PcrA
MDFDDLLFNTVVLFEQNPAVLTHYQNRFHYVLVDEYQDTNRLHYEIVHMISKIHQNICVCGDDDQIIYGWRGAESAIFGF